MSQPMAIASFRFPTCPFSHRLASPTCEGASNLPLHTTVKEAPHCADRPRRCYGFLTMIFAATYGFLKSRRIPILFSPCTPYNVSETVSLPSPQLLLSRHGLQLGTCRSRAPQHLVQHRPSRRIHLELDHAMSLPALD
eukprot:4035803-Pleurochrysis_carterae.AAC.1